MEAMTNVPTAPSVQRMEPLAKRLQRCVQLSGLSQRALSIKAGIASNGIQKMLERQSERVSPDVLRKIAIAAGVSEVWLSTGRGSPTSSEGHAPEEAPQAHPDYTTTSAPTWANFPGIDSLIATALANDASLAPWAAEKLKTLHPTILGPITPAVIGDLIRFVMRHAQPPTEPAPRGAVKK